MNWHNEDDIKIIFDLTNEVTRLTAEVERLKASEWSDKMVQMRLDEIIDYYQTELSEKEEEVKFSATLSNRASAQIKAMFAELEWMKRDLLLAQDDAKLAKAKLSRYEGAVEVEGTVCGTRLSNGTERIQTISFMPLIKGKCGQKVKVLILKEEVND